MKTKAFFFGIIIGILFNVTSQEVLKSTEEEYYDFLSLQGTVSRSTLNYRTLSDSIWQMQDETKPNPWQNNNIGTVFELKEADATKQGGNFFTKGIYQGVKVKAYGPQWFNSYNTDIPYGQNDGALWQGKGYNTSVTAGARLETYGFEITLKPNLNFSQNKDFDYMRGVYDNDGYSYFYKGNIDLVQRFGDSSYWTYDWGDTEIRYTWHTLTAGFGTQTVWLGPAFLNPMLGSNNAPTYPKIDFGIRRQSITLPFLDWYLGDIEARMWLGRLTESDYFDNDSSNDHNMITGFAIAYSPPIIDGLTLGINKICLCRWDDKDIKFLNPFYDTNANEDQKVALNIDWCFPQVGFEMYGELGIDDYVTDEISDRFHTAIYTVGTKKTFSLSKKHSIFGEIIIEWNKFEMSQDFQLQWPYMGYYAHGGITQGYTQKGQIMGAGSGYFGNSQLFALKIYYPKGSFYGFWHFNRPDTNYIDNIGVNTKQSEWLSTGETNHEQYARYRTIKTWGIRAEFFATKSLLLNAGFEKSLIRYWRYQRQNSDKKNVYLSFGAKYIL